jgi:hypothetical protein
MTIEIWEGTDASVEKAKDCSGQLTFWVTGSESEADVVAAVEAVAPLLIDVGGKIVVRTSISPNHRALQVWECKVKYSDEDDEKSEEDPEEGTWHFSFDTTSGTHKVSQSLSTVERYHRTAANAAPDLRGAIGWDGKKLNGTEVAVPKLEFTVEVYYDPADITTTFAATLARATGKTNDDAWVGFAECEVLFMGATGAGDRPLFTGARVKPAKVTFKFACSENRTDIAVGDIALDHTGAGVAGVDKKGWEYLWVYYTVKDTGGITFPTPEWAYVEKMYTPMDFAAFFGVS